MRVNHLSCAGLVFALGCLGHRPDGPCPAFRVRDGFRMDLLAREPLVADPVDLCYDEDGRAYVVEMRDYPVPERPDAPPERPPGTVRLLEDRDGDGAFDRATLFAENLPWPTSVAPWKGGVFVLAAPELWYFKDTDGDRRADVRRLVLSGFGRHNVQALANNLKWGLDHRIYGAGSGNGGNVRAEASAEIVPLRGRDFRFDPASGRVEALSGAARFGNAFDDWGNRFICNIRNPVQHVVLPAHSLDRNRLLAVRRTVHDVARSGDQVPVYRISPPEAWREERARRWAVEGQPMPRSELVGTGFFTSACAATVYRGSAYPEAYRGNVFLGEVAGNLIHRQTLAPDGVTFSGARADPDSEFVASTDPWFRPVNFVNAPDGTLHVLDMYRETIEHPWSIPDDIKARLDLLKGNDQGRIYRLTPPGFRAPPPPRLGGASTRDLVAHLESPHAWWRETAHRLLHERQDRAAVAPLRELLRGRLPLARLHALWSLEGLDALDDADLLAALADPAPGVREHAVRLAEGRTALRSPLLALARDPSPRVRLQVAFAADDAGALAEIARQDAPDEWIRAAILSSAVKGAGELLARVAPFAGEDRGWTELLRGLALTAGAGGRDVEVDLRPEHRFAVMSGLVEGLRRAGKPPPRRAREFLDAAGRTAADPKAPDAERAQAVALLRFDSFDRVRGILAPLLGARHPSEVQQAAVRTLGTFGRDEVPELLLRPWREYTPPVRADAVDVLLSRAPWMDAFLEAVEGGRVTASQIPSDRRARLVNHPDPKIKERSGRLLGLPASRAAVVARYQAALAIGGNAGRGHELYRRDCKTCHRSGDEGFPVGPDLSTVRHRSAEELLLHILDPNREVPPAYVGYLVRLKDGRDLSGIVAAETGRGLTLRAAGGAETTVLREDVETVASLGLSLMPEGLEGGLDLEQMADLIAFLRNP